MQAGKARWYMVQERAAETVDGYGQPIKTWVPVRMIWCRVQAVTSGESFRGAYVEGETTHVITCRYVSDMRLKDRLRFVDRVFSVVGVTDAEGTRAELSVSCVEEVA